MPIETPPDALDEHINGTLDAVIIAYNTAITTNSAEEASIEVWINLIRERRLRVYSGYYPGRISKPKAKHTSKFSQDAPYR